MEELNSAHHHSQAKCKSVQTSYIKQIKLFLYLRYNKHLINRAKSVCMGESDMTLLDQSHTSKTVLWIMIDLSTIIVMFK